MTLHVYAQGNGVAGLNEDQQGREDNGFDEHVLHEQGLSRPPFASPPRLKCKHSMALSHELAALALFVTVVPAVFCATLTTQESLAPATNFTPSPQLASCSCSATERGFSMADAQNLRLVLGQVSQIYALTERLLGPAVALQASHLYGVAIFNQCARKRGYEACANADAALRAPGFTTFCTYDAVTEVNLVVKKGKFRAAPACDSMARFTSNKKQRGVNQTISMPRPVVPGASPVPSVAVRGDDVGNVRIELGNKQGAAVSPVPSPSPSVGAEEVKVVNPTPLNEGCVAVEHLAGFALQHPRHRRRAVLCMDGFCATPNHAILVDGVYTSMGRLCRAEWECTREVRLVNNLKVAVNKMARYDDRIVITPYDVRFPVALVWLVQMMEDLVGIAHSAVISGLAVSSVLFVFASFDVKDKRHVST